MGEITLIDLLREDGKRSFKKRCKELYDKQKDVLDKAKKDEERVKMEKKLRELLKSWKKQVENELGDGQWWMDSDRGGDWLGYNKGSDSEESLVVNVSSLLADVFPFE